MRREARKDSEPENIDPVTVRRRAMDFLARREHGRQELAGKLAARGFSAKLIESTLDELVREGLQSDARFVESYVGSRSRKGYGPLRIRQELRERGIPENLFEPCLDDLGDDFWQIAVEARARKFGEVLPSAMKEQARQMRFLQQRGFPSDLVRRVVQGRID